MNAKSNQNRKESKRRLELEESTCTLTWICWLVKIAGVGSNQTNQGTINATLKKINDSEASEQARDGERWEKEGASKRESGRIGERERSVGYKVSKMNGRGPFCRSRKWDCISLEAKQFSSFFIILKSDELKKKVDTPSVFSLPLTLFSLVLTLLFHTFCFTSKHYCLLLSLTRLLPILLSLSLFLHLYL